MCAVCPRRCLIFLSIGSGSRGLMSRGNWEKLSLNHPPPLPLSTPNSSQEPPPLTHPSPPPPTIRCLPSPPPPPQGKKEPQKTENTNPPRLENNCTPVVDSRQHLCQSETWQHKNKNHFEHHNGAMGKMGEQQKWPRKNTLWERERGKGKGERGKGKGERGKGKMWEQEKWEN